MSQSDSNAEGASSAEDLLTPLIASFLSEPLSSLGKVEVDLNDLFERTGTIERHEQPLTRAIRGSNAKGTLSFSVGYFALQDFTKGSERAPAGTTIKLKVDGAGAPLLDDPGSRLRGDNCKSSEIGVVRPSPRQLRIAIGLFSCPTH